MPPTFSKALTSLVCQYQNTALYITVPFEALSSALSGDVSYLVCDKVIFKKVYVLEGSLSFSYICSDCPSKSRFSFELTKLGVTTIAGDG